MVTVFYHCPMWKWNNLPVSLTPSSHILLDASATKNIEEQQVTSSDDDYFLKNNLYESYEITNPNPINLPDSKKVYSLQKKLEQMHA